MTPELADFAGRWSVSRRIDDRLAGETGRFDGHATFRAVPEGLRYDEQGLLQLGEGRPLRAERAYLWRAESGRIVVDHADGRPFHAFDPSVGIGMHFCSPDTYAVCYRFAQWPSWTSHWRATGPRKDYDMVTDYSRA